ncbi:hypothetical protein R1sor_000773 [Riccia sorocarpa]|uniref:Uncharacterized protein n=1 Tax=Riccia sorocarpa TaxID=122646 RepID=A0ABD3GY90_9MARC
MSDHTSIFIPLASLQSGLSSLKKVIVVSGTVHGFLIASYKKVQLGRGDAERERVEQCNGERRGGRGGSSRPVTAQNKDTTPVTSPNPYEILDDDSCEDEEETTEAEVKQPEGSTKTGDIEDLFRSTGEEQGRATGQGSHTAVLMEIAKEKRKRELSQATKHNGPDEDLTGHTGDGEQQSTQVQTSTKKERQQGRCRSGRPKTLSPKH